jgi:hypothetical protein
VAGYWAALDSHRRGALTTNDPFYAFVLRARAAAANGVITPAR